MATVSNKTMCSDDEITRVGLMTPQDAQAFVTQLQQSRLVLFRDGNPMDLAVEINVKVQ